MGCKTIVLIFIRASTVCY